MVTDKDDIQPNQLSARVEPPGDNAAAAAAISGNQQQQDEEEKQQDEEEPLLSDYHLEQAIDLLSTLDPTAMTLQFPEAATDPALAFAPAATSNTNKPSQEPRPPVQDKATANNNNNNNTKSLATLSTTSSRKSSRKSKGKRRSQPSPGTKSSRRRTTTTTTTSSSSGSPSWTLSSKAAARRRSSTGGSTTHSNNNSNKPRYPLPCADVQPHRLVQPLVQATAAAATATTAVTTRTAANVLALCDVYHPLPDTYSLAYMARLLGFAVPVQPSVLAHQPVVYHPTLSSLCTTTTTTTSSSSLSLLPLRKEESYRHIPPVGSFARQIMWPTTTTTTTTTRNRMPHASPNRDDQQTLDVLDPLYESLILSFPPPPQGWNKDDDMGPPPPKEEEEEEDSTHCRPVTPTHHVRLWECLVQACTSTSYNNNNNNNNNNTIGTSQSSSRNRVGKERRRTSFVMTTLQQVQEYTGKQFRVHAYRPSSFLDDDDDDDDDEPNPGVHNRGSDETVDTHTQRDETGKQTHASSSSPTIPPISLTNLPLSDLPCSSSSSSSSRSSAPLGLVLSSSSGEAVGALLFRYEWYVTLARTALVIRWERLVLSDREIDSDANSLVALVLIALSMEHARQVQAFYGTYDYVSSSSEVPYVDLFQASFRLVRLVLPAAAATTTTTTTTSTTTTTVVPPPTVAATKESITGLATFMVETAETEMDTAMQEQGDDRTAKAVSNKTESGPPFTTAANKALHDTNVKAVVTEEKVRLVADLNKSSTRYALLTWKRLMQEKAQGVAQPKPAVENTKTTTKYRSILRLPNVEEATALVQGRTFKRKKLPGGIQTTSFYASAVPPQRNVTVRLEATIDENKSIKVFAFGGKNDEKAKTPLDIPDFVEEPVGYHVLKTFPLPEKTVIDDGEETDLLLDLKAKQTQVTELEAGMEPHLRELMQKIVDERLEFEKSGYLSKKEEEERIMDEYRKMRERRRVEDLEKQKRLEQDMEAVCCICNDGEVTPDNQIIFCDSCDVPVHQRCYGIEKIPPDDYYCLACRHLGRDEDEDATNENPLPLPVMCELCPHKGGALIRSNVPSSQDDESDLGKWVHAVCAKWQGLNFVNPRKPDLIEDFTELRDSFRRSRIHCSLCEGARGCMNKCRRIGCNYWLHILCARSSGLCEVIHGEDCHGDMPEYPWSLLCPTHSAIRADKIPKDAIPVPKLIEMANEFPPEPEPEKQPIVPVPFNTATGGQRKRLLEDHKYEQALIFELLYKRHVGIRCEVCDFQTESSKDITRCVKCTSSFCHGCKVDDDNFEGSYKCPACIFLDSKSAEETETPYCIACFQKNGPLRPAFATPIKKSTWINRKKEFLRSIFSKKFWVHTTCAFWHEGLFFSPTRPGSVDFRDVVTPHSKHGFINDKFRCEICGQMGGLKRICGHPGCVKKHDGENEEPLYFHPTCARQAGLQAALHATDEDDKVLLKCYRHGGNEYNIRAHLEDLIEIEKRRAGKNFARSDNPMKFSHGCRILHSAMRVMRVLGWSWRWAEWWVDYNSSWEPLLEPGEREEDMTKEQLKIVDSTRESRAEDARKCRLAALGAALRNRAYDKEEDGDFDNDALERGLRAVLKTKSLCGPLENYEVDFCVDWLARAYKTKNRLLGFGEDKIEVAREAFCLHMEDKSPKFELGGRTLPGKQKLGFRQIFETGVEEVDDFLKTEVLKDAYVPPPPPRSAPPVDKRPRGRPPIIRQEGEPPPRKRDRKRARSVEGTSDTARRSLSPRKKRGRRRSKPSPGNEGKTFSVFRLPNGRFVPRKDLAMYPDAVEYRVPRPGAAGDKNLMVGKVDSPPPPPLPKKRGPGRPPKDENAKRQAMESSHTDEASLIASENDDEPPKRRGRGRPPKKKRMTVQQEQEQQATSKGKGSRSARTARPQRTLTNYVPSDFDSDASSSSNDDDDKSQAEDKSKLSEPEPTLESQKKEEVLLERSGRGRVIRRPVLLVEQKEEGPQLLSSPRRMKKEEKKKKKKRGRPPKRIGLAQEEEEADNDDGDNNDNNDGDHDKEATDESNLMDWKIPSKTLFDKGRLAKSEAASPKSPPNTSEARIQTKVEQDDSDKVEGKPKSTSSDAQTRKSRSRSRRLTGDESESEEIQENSNDNSDDDDDDDDNDEMEETSLYNAPEDLIPLIDLVTKEKQVPSTPTNTTLSPSLGAAAAATPSRNESKDNGSDQPKTTTTTTTDLDAKTVGDAPMTDAPQPDDIDDESNEENDDGTTASSGSGSSSSSSGSSSSNNSGPELEIHRRLGRSEGKKDAVGKFKFI